MNNNEQKSKEQLLREFDEMKRIEEKAGKYYEQVAANPTVINQHVRNTFLLIAKDEVQHARAVQRIIQLIDTSL